MSPAVTFYFGNVPSIGFNQFCGHLVEKGVYYLVKVPSPKGRKIPLSANFYR